MADTHVFSKGEEIANAVTHGIGAILSLIGLVVLIVASTMHGTAWHVVSFTIFGTTMFLLYVSSTMVHALLPGKAKDLFEIFDHSSIYLFIAGTYTPFTFHIIQGTLGWTMFGIIWGLAIGGVVFKAFFVKKYLFTSTVIYVVMGWIVVIGWNQIIENLHRNGVILLVIGGLFYTVGAVFYVWRGFKYHHLVWHIFVLAGTTAHYFCVLLYLLP
ncbi:PAQR family membrane homeostasis protein TrhA [Oceanobacillus saliphilus]|uniref:PAQR family membrane homeostasis protein TrhA n=1 Tax=Oceanobacillus saliphilus TaxID=2925834 RepID=UPI00201E2074|nr:hemolysin III family protein [Oceanobacillus saliphilus]